MAALRSGYTTGTTATAAAMAAWIYASSRMAPEYVEVPLPPFTDNRSIKIPVERVGLEENCLAFAEARKDGGDDPDITNGMIIRADIFPGSKPGIEIDGGEGIGRVTLPGLPIKPGEAAINPTPRQQIFIGLRALNLPLPPLRIMISAPEGRERAKHTMNEKLGIIGGISILGTQGIERPYSNAAYRASIETAISVARATGSDTVCFGTGRRSLALLARAYPDLPSQCFIVAGDFVRDSLKSAAGFANIHWGCYFGKLVKMAQGLENTHASESSLNMDFLAGITGYAGLSECNTAREALDEILSRERGDILRRLLELAKSHALGFSQRQITIHLFHMDGRELVRA